jgi:hypothetical protein
VVVVCFGAAGATAGTGMAALGASSQLILKKKKKQVNEPAFVCLEDVYLGGKSGWN